MPWLTGLPWRTIAKILILLSVVAGIWYAIHSYGQRMYDKGFSKADEQWTETYNKSVEDHNVKIDALNLAGRIAARVHSETVANLKLTIDKILKDKDEVKKPRIPPTVVDNTGISLKCEKEIGQVYLGSSFSDKWNAIVDATNAGGAK